MIRLGVMVRAHRRTKTLRIVLSELKRHGTFPGLDVRPLAMVDRASPEVRSILDEFKVPVIESPFPLLEPGRERFMEALNVHLRELEKCDPDWVLVQDDDNWLEPLRAEKELPQALANPVVDAYFIKGLFFQDATDTYNTRRHHQSLQLWRHIKGFRYSTKRMIFVPDALHDAAIIACRTRILPVPAMDYGGFTEEDRIATYTAYERAGKIDPFVKALIEPPSLQTFPGDYDSSYGEWQDLMQSA